MIRAIAFECSNCSVLLLLTFVLILSNMQLCNRQSSQITQILNYCDFVLQTERHLNITLYDCNAQKKQTKNFRQS